MTAPRTAALTRALRPAPLHLPVLAAKSWQEYLDAHDGDAERAGKAARADVAAREGQNSAARRFVDAYKGVIEGLGLPGNPEDAVSAAEQAAAAVKKLKDTAGSSDASSKALEAAHAALRELGIDPEKIPEGVAAAQAKFAKGETADKLQRQVEYGKAAQALGFDGAKLLHQLRDEAGIPELRKQKVKVVQNGVETEQEQDVWGIATRDDKGTETAFTPLAEHAGVKGWEASLKAPSTPAGPAAPVITTPTLVSQPATPAPVVSGAVKLDLGGLSTGNAV